MSRCKLTKFNVCDTKEHLLHTLITTSIINIGVKKGWWMMLNNKSIIKDRLRTLREMQSKSQQDIANLLSISRTSYNKYETGVHDPSIETLLLLSDYYNVSVDYLLGHDAELAVSDKFTDDEIRLVLDYRKCAEKELFHELINDTASLANLTPSEQSLIARYRSLNPTAKRSISDFIEFLMTKKM